jgi:hypothetical protein
MASRAANAAPMASSAKAMTINPIAPAGLVLHGKDTVKITNSKLYIINPYKLSTSAQGVISENSIISTLPTNPSPSGHACIWGASTNNLANCAAGLIADGTSTGIARCRPAR